MTGTAQHGTRLVNLISLVVSGEQRPKHVVLGHHCSTSEDVDGRVVVGRPEQDLRSSVPSCADIISERRLASDFTCQTKVSDLNCVSFNQEVLRLQISMEEAVLVHVSETLESLVHDGRDLLLWEVLLSVFHELVDILHHVLKYEVKVVIDSDDFFQFDYVDVVQLT